MANISGVYSDTSIFAASAPCPPSSSLFLSLLGFLVPRLFSSSSCPVCPYYYSSSSSSSAAAAAAAAPAPAPSKFCYRSISQWIWQFWGLDRSGLIIPNWKAIRWVEWLEIVKSMEDGGAVKTELSMGVGIGIIWLGRQESGTTLGGGSLSRTP